jgi:glycine cleavage system regulatory protein
VSPLVITVIGKDRPGLVEAVAVAVADHGGSWVESQMSRLAGQFAGILSVSVPEARVEELREALLALGAGGLRVHVERGEDESPDEGRAMTLELVGGDRPGIIRKVSEALAAQGVNVEELSTECEGAPWSGDTLFRANARLRAPLSLRPERLRESLEALGADLMVDITISEPEPG